MRIIFCGDRTWDDVNFIKFVLSKLPGDTIIIEGEANGADHLSRVAAEELGYEVLKFSAK